MVDKELECNSFVECDNYKSAHIFHDKVEMQINYEIIHGNYVICDKPMNIVSALGAIPKDDGRVRLIHDASRPVMNSLNDYAVDTTCSYMDLNDACRIIRPGDFLAKIDLKSAYRSVNIHPSNYKYTGLKWHFKGDSKVTYMYDARLPFGAAKSPSIFQRLSSCVCRIVKKLYDCNAIVYIDDFLIIESSYEKCTHSMNMLLQVLRKLGFSINWNKVDTPSQQIVFLGVYIDTCNMTLSLPCDKLCQFYDLLVDFKARKRASKVQLESLIGKLNWACQVIKGGRTFLRRIIDLKNCLRKQRDKTLLSDDFRMDLQWWIDFLPLFNGSVHILDPRPVRSLCTDACNTGCGGYFAGDYFYVNWTTDLPEMTEQHINVKETMAIVLALKRWAPLLSDKRVIVRTDNIAAKSYINKGASRNTFIMPYLRSLFWTQACYNFSVSAIYVKGRLNTIADTISRLAEPNMLTKLYDFIPFDAVLFRPLDISDLSKHMSSAFIFCRWGRASTSTGRDGKQTTNAWLGREHT